MIDFKNDGLGYEPRFTQLEVSTKIRLLRPKVTHPDDVSFDTLCDIGLYPPAVDPGENRDEAAKAVAWVRLARIMSVKK